MTTLDEIELNIMFGSTDPDYATVKWKVSEVKRINWMAKYMAAVYIDLIASGIPSMDAAEMVAASFLAILNARSVDSAEEQQTTYNTY